MVDSPTDLPYTLEIDDKITVECIWNWEDHRAETISIKVRD